MGRKKYNNKISNIVYVLITIFIAFSIYLGNEGIEKDNGNAINNNTINNIDVNSNLKIYYLNVGQADSILIQNNGQNMLIDAGNNDDGVKIVEYLKSMGISKIDYLIGTHPHEDHIGSLDDVINNFDIGSIYMPKVANTTKTFEDVLDAIENKNLTVKEPTIGETFNMQDAKFKILWAGTNSEDLNSCSIVLKLTFGNLSYLFTGDIEEEGENEIINRGEDIKASVLKIAHHGSRSSSSSLFLDKVSPKIAVIMVGKENSYGHPNKKILDRLKEKNIEVYRTDTDGTILITSDGISNKVEILNEINLDG